jgi:hypothetical protein
MIDSAESASALEATSPASVPGLLSVGRGVVMFTASTCRSDMFKKRDFFDTSGRHVDDVDMSRGHV